MNFDDVTRAVEDAEFTLKLADRHATQIAKLLVGRVRRVDSTYTLKALKLELRDFNANTGRWKALGEK